MEPRNKYFINDHLGHLAEELGIVSSDVYSFKFIPIGDEKIKFDISLINLKSFQENTFIRVDDNFITKNIQDSDDSSKSQIDGSLTEFDSTLKFKANLEVVFLEYDEVFLNLIVNLFTELTSSLIDSGNSITGVKFEFNNPISNYDIGKINVKEKLKDQIETVFSNFHEMSDYYFDIPNSNKDKIYRSSYDEDFKLEENFTLSDEVFRDSSEEIIKMENIDEADESKVKFISYDVFYGTNRKKDANVNFGPKWDQILNLGVCKVSIPLKHKVGDLERPNFFKRLIFGENPEKYFTILEITSLEKTNFISTLSEKLDSSSKKEAVLFIHGYNVSFEEGARRAAQLGYDLNCEWGVFLYSWPSKGTVTDYIADSNAVDASVKYFKEFLRILFSVQKIEKLHIIAHSMGNILLTKTIIALTDEKEFPNSIVKEIILAAPDINKEIFLNEIAPKIIIKDSKSPRFTLYASSKDKALIVSKKLSDFQRIGEGGKSLIVLKGIDSIDASKVDTNLLGHGYFSEASSVIVDIYYTLQGIEPKNRHLDPYKINFNNEDLLYWAFKNTV